MSKLKVETIKATIDGKLCHIPAHEVRDIIFANGKHGISIEIQGIDGQYQLPGPSLGYTIKVDVEKEAIVVNFSKDGPLVPIIRFSHGNLSHLHPLVKYEAIPDDELDDFCMRP